MVKKVLTINYSDPTGESGIQADLQNFQTLNVFGFTVITSLTSITQKNKEMCEIIEASTIKKQLETVFATGSIDAIKISHLNSLEDVKIIKEFIQKFQVKHILYEIDVFAAEDKLLNEFLSLTPVLVINEEFTPLIEGNLHTLLNQVNYLFIKKDKVYNEYFGYNQETSFSIAHPVLSSFLTAELAHKNTLHHLSKNTL